MIKTNPTKIEWTDRVWNPVTGCLHNCWYCYAKKLFTRFHRSFEPEFHADRFIGGKELKKSVKIFVCSVADLFAPWTPEKWRELVLDEIQKPEYNHLTFQLLTKNPENIRLEAKENIWIGATITNQMETPLIGKLINSYKGLKFLSLEPILEFIKFHDLFLKHINWVIVGKLTGSKKVKLNNEWILSIKNDCRQLGIPIFLKNNINWHEKIQEFPINDTQY